MTEPADIAAAKATLRTTVRGDRSELVQRNLRDARDAAIQSHLIAEIDRLDPDRGSEIAAYCPMEAEPGGCHLPDALGATGRRVWVPITDPERHVLHWLPWQSAKYSHTGAFGISEPLPAKGNTALTTAELVERVIAVVIPALAVDSNGVRLGQGGGFYDRALSAFRSNPHEHGTLIAIVDHEHYGIRVPGTDLDIMVPVVVTDTGVFRTQALDRL